MLTDRPFALVTGGAVRLGKAIVLELARAGYAIGLHYHRSEKEAQQTAEEIAGLNVGVVLLQADLRKPAEIFAMFEKAKNFSSQISVLANSAAIMPRGNLQTMQVDAWDDVMNLNLRAAWLCGQQAAEMMPNGGVMINITDTGTTKTWSGFPAYQISKAGLEALTRLQAKTYAPKIRVNAIAPGLILPADDLPAKEWQRLIDRTALKTGGSTEAISKTVLFLIQNSHITGTTITVDGGYQLMS